MLSRKIIFILIISFVFPQNVMSGYGYGSSNHISPSTIGVSNEILPSFKQDVSISNPSTWHGLLFTYLNSNINFQNTRFKNTSNTSFSLSSAKLIVPWKQKMAFGISFQPFLSRELTVSDSTANSFIFSDEELSINRVNNSSGGPSLGQLSFGYKINEFDSVGSNLNVVFGSSRSTRNLIINDENHLLQSRDYFSGSMIDLFYTTSRFKYKDKPVLIAASIRLPINGINVENDSYQAFIDLNENNYHDTNDFPDIGQALLPFNQIFKNDIRITNFSFGSDYEFSPRKHLQVELSNWKDSGKHLNDSSIFEGFIESKTKISIGYVKFSKPFSKDKFNYRGSIFLQNYDSKNLENISEVGLGLGVGFNFGLTGNQIDIGYNFSRRSGINIVDSENLHIFNVGISIGDLWFVKRREI